MAEHEQEELEFHVWTNDEDKLWWKTDACGYTTQRARAGRFTLAEALDHCRRDHQWEIGTDTPRVMMVPAGPRR